MQFEQVIGQKAVKEQLMQLVQQNRLSHALLFLGREGSGGLPLAMAFAQYIVCEKVQSWLHPAPAGPSLFGETAPAPPAAAPADSCGICPACVKSRQLVHPDIHFSYPVIPKKSGDRPISSDYISDWREFIQQYPYGNVYDWLQSIKAENRQGNITAEECNDITRKISLKSFESGYKVLIIWMPEYLANSGNKLLKLIEEPPPDTLFLLVAENEEQILPTILSRTQLVKLHRLSQDEIEAALELRTGAQMDKARRVASLCDGNYHEALQLLQHEENDWEQLLREWLNSLMKRNYPAQVKWLDEMSKLGRENQKQFLKYFTHLLETAIRLQFIAGGSNAPDNELDFARRLNKLCGAGQQEAIIRELDKAGYYIERNANAKMLFHALSIRLYHIIADNSLILTN